MSTLGHSEAYRTMNTLSPCRATQWHFVSICTLLLGSLLSNPALAEDPWEPGMAQLQLVEGADIGELIAEHNVVLLDELHPLYLVELPIQGDDYIEWLDDDPLTVWAEPAYTDETPEGVLQMVVAIVGGTISEYEDQDVYSRIGLDYIHQFTAGEGVTVAVLDTGVDYNHLALTGAIVGGPDYIGNDMDPMEERNFINEDGDEQTDEGYGHGTMVAGIIHLAAPGADIMAIRVLDDEGRGLAFDVCKGIRYAVENGADVINLSLGISQTCEAIEYEIDLAAEAGVVMVSAAGNAGIEDCLFPAINRNVLAVASLDTLDVKSTFSNFDVEIALSAPGDGIRSPFPEDGYALGAGTSFATPFVSAQAALVLSVHPTLHKVTAEAIMGDGVIGVDYLPGNGPFMFKLGSGRVDGFQTWNSINHAASVEPSPLLVGGIDVFPNPSIVGQEVGVRWSGSSTNPLDAEIHAVDGRLVARVAKSAGSEVMAWDGKTVSGEPAPAGIYYILVSNGEQNRQTRLVRVR